MTVKWLLPALLLLAPAALTGQGNSSAPARPVPFVDATAAAKITFVHQSGASVNKYMIESFGWDRLVFGSDRPVLTLNGTLTQWVTALKTIVAGASEDEQAALFHRNAERVYGV